MDKLALSTASVDFISTIIVNPLGVAKVWISHCLPMEWESFPTARFG